MKTWRQVGFSSVIACRMIAERLGVSVSMIEKHVSAALAHLKSRLDEAHS